MTAFLQRFNKMRPYRFEAHVVQAACAHLTVTHWGKDQQCRYQAYSCETQPLVPLDLGNLGDSTDHLDCANKS